MELYELRQLVAFAECGTLSNAAEALHLSQPALSRNMKKLEEEQNNLTRVSDILSELEKQIGPLEKQSAVAKE